MYFSNKFIQRQKEYTTLEKFVSSPYFRKSFEIKDKGGKYEITVAGLGFYEIYFNGKNITKGMLAPYITNPDKIIYYDNYDVTKLVKVGKNVIGLQLGNGFLNNPAGNVWGFDKGEYRDSPKFALAFEVDGKLLFEADESFLSCDSPIYFDDLRAGEYYDANKEINGWNKIEFNDCKWNRPIIAKTPNGESMLCESEVIGVVKEYKTVKILKSKKGYIYCFKYNNSGLPRLKIKGKKGQKITLTCGEVLVDGELDMTNLIFEDKTVDGFMQRDIYICKGEGVEVYMPRFTYHGFQYVLVEGIEEKQAKKSLITYVEIHSKIEKVGEFHCSDPIINKLQENTCRSTISNFHYFPTDCPHREKNGWTGDASLSAEQTMLNFNPTKSYKAWLNCIRKAQTKEGNIPGMIPTYKFAYDWGYGPAWDSAFINIPYYVYKYEGDKDIIIENLESFIKYFEFVMSKRDEDGLLGFGLGDWCQPSRPAGAYETDLRITDTLYTMDNLYKTGKMFDVVGKDSQKIKQYREELRKSFRKYFIKDGRIKDEYATQTAVSMALYYKAFEFGEDKFAFNQLIKLIRAKGNRFDTGVLGARTLFRTLSDYGRSDIAYKLITSPEFPSYAYHLKYGATTLFEDFHRLDDEKLIVIDGVSKLNSLNHHFWGDISAWFYKYIGGIRINPGLTNPNRIVIKPFFVDEISSCTVKRKYKNGYLKVKWWRINGEIKVKVSVPKGVKIIKEY